MSMTFGAAFAGVGPAPMFGFVAGGLGGAGIRGSFGTGGSGGGTLGAPGTGGGTVPVSIRGTVFTSEGRIEWLPSPSVGE